jgi:hypothetical protein
MKPVVSGLPKPAPDAMLAESLDLEGAIAVFHGLLYPFLENARFNAMAIFKTGEANHLLFHTQNSTSSEARSEKREAGRRQT